MNSNDPLVSVCIPTFNSESYLVETLGSVLNQTHRRIEVLISDGGSTDSTLTLISQIADNRITVLTSQARLLPWENWTKALQMANGDYTMLLCHDDLLRPNAISYLLGLHLQFEDAVATAGSRSLINETGSLLKFQRRQKFPLKIWDSKSLISEVFSSGTNPIGEGLCVLWKTRLGPPEFSSRWSYYIDLDYWLQLAKSGPIYQTDVVVGSFRVTRSSWTSQIGMKVSKEITKYFNYLYECEVVTKLQYIRGITFALAQGFARPVLQRLVNR
jgi:glycosyltransferase involved in cell wall biosynthesis